MLHQFLTLGPHFVRKGDATPQKIRISPHVCASYTHDPRRGSRFVTHRLAAPAAKREKSGQGAGPELAVSLPYGSSLLSEGERGRRPCRRPTPPPRTIKKSRVLRCFLLFPFFDSCGPRWVNMGQHRPQDGPT